MKKATTQAVTRRDFIRGGSLATIMAMMGGIEIRAADNPEADAETTDYQGLVTPLNCAVIGCGPWGREILRTLARLPCAPVAAICDTYEPWLTRAAKEAPNAARFQNYRQVLEKKDVQGVIVATPSCQHRQIVLDTLEAGKHVYCEAPLASTIEDARAIATAARKARTLHFQAGLQSRADPQIFHLCRFVRTGVMGKMVKAHGQFHKRESWRRASPNAEREKELNWRLHGSTSTGLVGEIGIHQLDIANWFIMSPPQAAIGYGNILQWADGRDVPDTVHAVLEYPGGVFVAYDSTIANSFDTEYNVFYGTHCAIMMRERRAWMFKETDSPLLGWEVYARKEQFFKESGIVLDADATKQTDPSKKKAKDLETEDETPLHYALRAFVVNSNITQGGVEDFTASFGSSDKAALEEYLAGLAKKKLPCAGWLDAYVATVTAIMANQAVVKGARILIPNELFEV